MEEIFIFIMQRYDCSLKVKMRNKLPNNEFILIVLNLFDGLIELRMNNLIHSDIKPGNILVNKEGRCFFSDFGMALKLKIRDKSISENKGYTE